MNLKQQLEIQALVDGELAVNDATASATPRVPSA